MERLGTESEDKSVKGNWRVGHLLLRLLVVILMPQVASGDLASEYEDQIKSILKRSCQECHGPKKSKGGLNFAEITSYEEVMDDAELWRMVLERVQASEMPPSGSPEMDYGQRQTLMGWLRKLPKPELDCEQLASDRTQNYYRGYVMSRRLTRFEYQNAVNDLFGLQLNLADTLPADGSGGEGFDTNGSTLFSSPLLVEKYLEAADQVIHSVLNSSTARDQFYQITGESSQTTVNERARKIIEHFTYRAFRRPVTEEDADKFLDIFAQGAEMGYSFNEAIGLALKGLLISPKFLFLIEEESGEPGIHPLSSYELAARLSFFIWSSIPDDRLLTLADSGQIRKKEVLESEVVRMLQDSRSSALAERFAIQWLDLDDMGIAVAPDHHKFPEFDPNLLESMRGEIIHFFADLFRNDRSILNFINGDYSFIDARLANLYQIPLDQGPSHQHFQKVAFGPDSVRGGVLGMAGIHMATSYPGRTSPVLRGRWILESIIGDRVPPPPPDVPELEESEETEQPASLRKQLELHRTNPDCAACHDRMDPLGFGLENFDVLGRWRDKVGDTPIDATGKLPSGESFSGPAELKSIILKKQDKVIEHLVKKMTGFALGRELNDFDQCIIRDASLALKANDFKPSSLVKTIATSFPFRYRFYAIQE